MTADGTMQPRPGPRRSAVRDPDAVRGPSHQTGDVGPPRRRRWCRAGRPSRPGPASCRSRPGSRRRATGNRSSPRRSVRSVDDGAADRAATDAPCPRSVGGVTDEARHGATANSVPRPPVLSIVATGANGSMAPRTTGVASSGSRGSSRTTSCPATAPEASPRRPSSSPSSEDESVGGEVDDARARSDGGAADSGTRRHPSRRTAPDPVMATASWSANPTPSIVDVDLTDEPRVDRCAGMVRARLARFVRQARRPATSSMVRT